MTESTERSPLAALLADPAKLAEVSLEVLERLWSMQQQADATLSKRAYFAALSEFQHECPEIRHDHTVKDKHGKLLYTYASLPCIVKTIRDAEHQCGLSHRFDTEFDEGGGIQVVCVVTHTSGHSEPTTVRIPPTKGMNTNSAQNRGIEITYGKRYAIEGAYGIVTGEGDTDARHVASPDEPVIGEHQAADMEIMLSDAGADITAFLAWASEVAGHDIKSVDDMPERMRTQAVKMIERKLKEGPS